MANKPKDTRNGVDQLNDNLTSLEQKIENDSKTQKMLAWGCIAASALVLLVLLYIYAIHKPGVESANTAVGQADATLLAGNDSLALEQYKQVAKEYGHEGGNRANLNAAILLYKQGKWQEALDYLNDYSRRDNVIGAGAEALKGDCYVNLKNYDQALDCFKKAAKISDNNPAYTPYFIMKQATVYAELKNYKEEAACYQDILDNYPEYGPSINVDIEKYLASAQAHAGE